MGSAIGFFIALAIGAAFIAVWFTKASDLWKKSESLWEGIEIRDWNWGISTDSILIGVFYLIASIIIFVMGVTMLKIDRAKEKWRIKLQRAFEGKRLSSTSL
jgi:high-affinity iron transporter